MYNFEVVNKNHVANAKLPDNVIRVGAKTMSIGEKLVMRYKSGETKSGCIKTVLRIEHDPVNQAIRLTRDDDGFQWCTNAPDAVSMNRSIPSELRKKGTLIVGDYTETEPHSNIFVLAR